jgi:hypothetical protein
MSIADAYRAGYLDAARGASGAGTAGRAATGVRARDAQDYRTAIVALRLFADQVLAAQLRKCSAASGSRPEVDAVIENCNSCW